jgi:hypothetical protein
MIDDLFTVSRSKHGVFISTTREGKEVITALTEEVCIEATRAYLKWSQEGFPETATHEGTVGGKL